MYFSSSSEIVPRHEACVASFFRQNLKRGGHKSIRESRLLDEAFSAAVFFEVLLHF
jgi:hypothetical protein